MLEQEFKALVLKYTDQKKLADKLWNEIETAYSEPERYFHNLSHVSQMFEALSPYTHLMKDWDTLAFSIFYHDVVYDVLNYVTENTNEDQSAEQAGESLKQTGLATGKIEHCKQQILATKKHEKSTEADTNFLIDADLSILGQPWNVYEVYMKNIRKEYAVYPDAIFHAGRNKVLKRFLQMTRLFKTDPFQHAYAELAKENMTRELEIISFS